MPVRFDTSSMEGQLHLSDRKLLSARLARLIALSAARFFGKIEPPVEVKEFAESTDLAIRQVLRRHEESVDEPAVDATMGEIREKLNGLENAAGTADLESGIGALEAEFARLDCNACSAYAERICRGAFNDFRLFEDGDERPGGLCVDFVRSLTEFLQEWAEALFREFGNGKALLDPPKDVSIRMKSLSKEHDGTLPLEGSYDPIVGALTLKWPVDPDRSEAVDDAILMLPYLLFHEVFVHGGQGRALAEQIARIPPQCAFTEGAVDAAARHLLIYRILGNALPERFVPMREWFRERCKSYGDERGRMVSANEQLAVRKSDNSRIRKARAVGTRYVWEALKEVEENAEKPRRWALQIVIRLNLALNVAERESFMMKVGFWETATPESRDELVTIFDRFLEDDDVTGLLRRLDRLGLP